MIHRTLHCILQTFERPSAIMHQDSTEVKQEVTEYQKKAEWNVSPIGKESFLSNLLQREPSCSLVKLCSTDSPTDPVLSSCQAQSTHTDRPQSTNPWLPKHEVKKENNQPKTTPQLSPTQPRWNSTAPDKVAWSATSNGQWSRVATMLWRGGEHVLKKIHFNYNWQNKWCNYWWHEIIQWINSRSMCVMYWAFFNYQIKSSQLWPEFVYTVHNLASPFRSSNCHHHK